MTASRRGGWLLGLGLVLIALTFPELALHHPEEVEIATRQRVAAFVALDLAGAAAYFAAVALVLSGPAPRWAVPVVLAASVLMRAGPLAAPPILSSDAYRYVWDGRVQAHGINPYMYLPAAPELAGLQDEAVYSKMNRVGTAPTIYPPVAQMLFAAVGQVWPSVFGIKAMMVGFEALAIGVMLYLLRLAGLGREQALIYAWNPVAVWEYAGNGHIDAASIGFIALALLAITVRRSTLAGVALAAATLCKFLPAVLFPAFWRRWDWRMVAAAAVTTGACYTLYLSAGWRVLGYLPGYADEEGLGSGGGVFAVRVLALFGPVPLWAGKLVIVATLAGLMATAAALAFGPPLPVAPGPRAVVVARGAVIVAAAVMVGISPHYPWYLGWLAYLACLAPIPSVIYLSAAGVLLYLDPGRDRLLWPALVYGGFLLLAAADLSRAFRPQAVPRAAR